MEEVQGFTRSHWTPPLGKHSLWYHQSDVPTPVLVFFSSPACWKQSKKSKRWTLLKMGVWQINWWEAIQ
jgi:hypothetical protein